MLLEVQAQVYAPSVDTEFPCPVNASYTACDVAKHVFNMSTACITDAEAHAFIATAVNTSVFERPKWHPTAMWSPTLLDVTLAFVATFTAFFAITSAFYTRRKLYDDLSETKREQ